MRDGARILAARWTRRLLLAAVASSAALAAAASPGREGPPDQEAIDLAARLGALAQAAADPASAALPASALLERAGLPLAAGLPTADPALVGPAPISLASQTPVILPARQPREAAQAQLVDLRLALTLLSQAHGIEEDWAVLNAQTVPGRTVLVVTGGRVDLAGLARLADQLGAPHDVEGRALLLRAPVVVWEGASLDLGPGDDLRLSRPDGAFLLSFGDVRIDGATVAAVGEPNEVARAFVPFLTVANGGRLDVHRATFRDLGFGETPKFAGVSVLRTFVSDAAAPSVVEDSTFDGVLSLVIRGDRGATVAGNRFEGARGAALVVSRALGPRILSNLFLGPMPTNAVRIQDGSAGTVVTGNVILGGERAGIVVRHSGEGEFGGVLVSGNIVWDREGAGVVLFDADCASVSSNLILGNAQKGIEVRETEGATIESNRILDNRNAALWLSDQSPEALTSVRGNQIAWNGAGFAGARGGQLLLDGNDLSEQFLQMLSGDLASQSAHVVRDLRGEAPIILTAAGLAGLPAAPASAAANPAGACAP